MAKKKRKHSHRYIESPTGEFRKVAQVTMGGGMVGTMTPLLGAPTPANLSAATEGMVGFAILAPTAKVGFDAVDRIYESGKKKKK